MEDKYKIIDLNSVREEKAEDIFDLQKVPFEDLTDREKNALEKLYGDNPNKYLE